MNPSHNKTENQALEIRRLERETDSWKARVANLSKKLEEAKQKAKNAELNGSLELQRATESLNNKNQSLIDELDDLRYNYQDALRQNIQMEQELKENRSKRLI